MAQINTKIGKNYGRIAGANRDDARRTAGVRTDVGRSSDGASPLCLRRLMETSMPEILLRERDGAPLLRLYRTGGFWTAFERSAFLLCRLLPECRVNIALNPETKSPVVMTAVPDETLRPLGVRLGFPCGTAEYMEIPASETGAEEYSRWRRDEVGRFAPALTTII